MLVLKFEATGGGSSLSSFFGCVGGVFHHYPTYRNGNLNISELPLVCNISRAPA